MGVREFALAARSSYAGARIRRFVAGNLDEIRAAAAEDGYGPTGGGKRRVYVYWAQGLEHAPVVVRLCHRQLLRHHAEEDVVVLDDGNLRELVDLPAHVRDKVGGDRTLQADMIRVELLARHGGVWVDATCFVRENVLDATQELLGSGFFAFSRADRPLANWFLASAPDSYIIAMWREALYHYWRHFDHRLDYFLPHQVFAALLRLDPAFAASWARTPTVSAEGPHLFQRAMHEPYDAARFRALLDGCFVHKLSWKVRPETLTGDTLLARLIEEGLGHDGDQLAAR